MLESRTVPFFTPEDGRVDPFVGIRQRDEARNLAVALEQECAVLADTLKLFTHDYVPDPQWPGSCRRCMGRADDLPHRTPDFLRKRHGLGV